MSFTQISFGQKELANFDQAQRNEWLLTNGLGGYASSTILGLNSRKYHALLVASLRPPGERTVILSKLDEDVKIGDQTYQLGANDFQHDIYPQGFKLLTNFSLSPFPKYTYSMPGFELNKTIYLQQEKNSVVAVYEVNNRTSMDSTINIYPLVSYRHYHYVINRKQNPIWVSQTQTENTVELAFDNPAAIVKIKIVDGQFNPNGTWVEGLFYREESNRGESSGDEGYQPGYFEVKIPKSSTVKFAIATVVEESRELCEKSLKSLAQDLGSIERSIADEQKQRESIVDKFFSANKQTQPNSGFNWMLHAADQFIVRGTDNQRFVIAGYQWFGSWGRDTFVSLPGLLLVNGRFEDAKSVIQDYTRFCKQGLIPNLIDDKTGEPLYNTVDGTLWYINSILQYIKYSRDAKFVKNSLWNNIKEIIDYYRKGTLNEIRIDGDGLLAHGPQLTWMDTIVEGAPFTPRAGKAVEVQALWYNSLKTLHLLASAFGEKESASEFSNMADKAKISFNSAFWNAQSGSLFDLIDPNGQPDYALRPNQIIALCLDFPIIDDNVKANSIVDFVQRELLTPAGLRTLSPKDSRYRGRYEGDRTSRDRAYHNGSIWAWLSGPMTTAYLKTKGYSPTNIEAAYQNFIRPLFTDELMRGGLGTLNEINDGDAPYTPRGCIAQAWSVAEPLRAYVEDILHVQPRYEQSYRV